MTSIRKPALRAAMIAGMVLVAWPLSAFAAASKVTICHNPPGNPGKTITISVGEPALSAHLAHGDTVGTCANEDKDKSKNKTEQWTVCTPPDKSGTKDKSGNKGERRSLKVSREDVQKHVEAGASVGDCTSATTVCDCTKPPLTNEIAALDDRYTKADKASKDNDDLRAKHNKDIEDDDAELTKLDDDWSKATGNAKAAIAQNKADVQKRKDEHVKAKAEHDKSYDKVKSDNEAVKTKTKADKDAKVKASDDNKAKGAGAYQGGSCSCPGGKTGSWVYILSPNKTSREIRGK